MRRSTETACLVVGGGCFDKAERRLGGSMMESAGWKIARRCVKRLSAVGLRLGPILCSLALLGTACVAVVGPPSPPPAGQVWVERGGQWVLVAPPPSEGPYRWVGSGWVPDPTPPPSGSEWVPGHWGPRGWVAGHWAPVAAGGPGAVWVPGHWAGSVWVAGHWKGGPAGRAWIPGHRGPRGRWIHGHWR